MRCLGVQGGSRLIAQKHIRFRDQCPGDSHPLLLSAGQLCRIAVGLVGQIHQFQKLPCFRLCGFPVRPAQPEGQHDIIQAGALHEQVETLEDHGNLPSHGTQLLLVHGSHIPAVHQHRTFRRPFQHVDTADQRTLARAAHTDDAVHIPVLNRQVDVAQRVHRSVQRLKLLGQILQLNHVKASVFPKYNLL